MSEGQCSPSEVQSEAGEWGDVESHKRRIAIMFHLYWCSVSKEV